MKYLIFIIILLSYDFKSPDGPCRVSDEFHNTFAMIKADGNAKIITRKQYMQLPDCN